MPLPIPELVAQASDHNCQDPDCDNLYDLVIFRTRDGEANWLCWVHAYAFLAGVLEGIAREAQAAAAEHEEGLAAASDAQEAANLAESIDATDAQQGPRESAEDILARYRT